MTCLKPWTVMAIVLSRYDLIYIIYNNYNCWTSRSINQSENIYWTM